ncbi:MAG TPA: hypothetical protein DEV81_08920 [Cyanobacteria bacterium UBA11049]|nr:hypothetical protein [Cyanobacteria bacterium UBA11049]
MKSWMNKKQQLRQLILLACTLGILFCTQSVNAQNNSFCRPQIIVTDTKLSYEGELNDTCKQRITTFSDALKELAKANVVYLGETHDNSEDHKIQLQIIQELQRRNPKKIAIAMEMFQHPYQNILNRYLAGELSEQELVEQSEYNQRWGYPWEYYAPILRFAKEKQLPVIALNIPAQITRQVARAGLESLKPQQLLLIPPLKEIQTDNIEYRQLLAKSFGQHHHFSHGNSSGFERFFQAQVVWDETMAAQIAKFLQANSRDRVVVLAGQGHIIYNYGIPSRVARRLQNKRFVQRSVLLSPPQEDFVDTHPPIADFVWQQK